MLVVCVCQCLASKGDYADAVSALHAALKIEPNLRVCWSLAALFRQVTLCQ